MDFDARALTEPVDKHAVKEFSRQLKAAGRTPRTQRGVIVAVILVAFFFGNFTLFGTSFTVMLATAGQGSSPLTALPLLPMVLFLGIGTLLVVFALRRNAKAKERRYRLDRFARANHMQYFPSSPQPPLPGMIFHHGSDRKASDLLRGERPRFVEFGNYRYTTGSGKNQTTHKWGYVAVKLDVPLPHIVLDALSNNGLFGASNLPSSFDKDQRLSLEGDFDRHFALYCPNGYERDALYLFTPDIMARFIDHAAALDVEIIDDWLFLYAKRDFSTLDPNTWGWLFSVIRALLVKFEQWARWRDDRLRIEQGPDAAHHAPNHELPFVAPAGMLTPPPGVAREGQRLRRGFRWGVLVPFIAVAIWIAFQFLSGFAQVFFRGF